MFDIFSPTVKVKIITTRVTRDEFPHQPTTASATHGLIAFEHAFLSVDEQMVMALTAVRLEGYTQPSLSTTVACTI